MSLPYIASVLYILILHTCAPALLKCVQVCFHLLLEALKGGAQLSLTLLA